MSLVEKESTIRAQAVACPVCAGKDFGVPQKARDRLHGITGTFSYVRCGACGLVFMNPQVVEQDIPLLYPVDYDPHAVSMGSTGPSIPPNGTRPNAIQSFFDDFFTREKIDPKICRLHRNSRVLDVGCGNGRFLKDVKDRYGCEVSGVDLSEAAVQAAQTGYGLTLFHGGLEAANFPADHFNAVTAWWYLEHVPHPVAMVREIARVLKPGGCCILGVPNTRSLAATLFGNCWYHLDCPRHLCLFSPGSMQTVLKQAGLTPRKIFYDTTTGGLLGSLAYAAGGDGKSARKWRRKFWLRQLFLPFTALLGLCGWGDTMVVYAEKPA